jgi:hypothetical protein
MLVLLWARSLRLVYLTNYPALWLTALLVPIHGSAFIFYAALVHKQCDSVGCDWPTVSRNPSEDFKMSHHWHFVPVMSGKNGRHERTDSVLL